jgi:hypothetical protein
LANLQGVEVAAFGVDAAQITVSQWQALKGFWEAYFRSAGARLTAYSPLRELTM